MTDPASPSTAPADPADSPPPKAVKKPYALERNLVGAVFFALVGYVIINGGFEIWRETYRDPYVTAPAQHCSDGIHALYTSYQSTFYPAVIHGAAITPRQASAQPAFAATLVGLDEQLSAMRAVCLREGADATAAYEAMTLWRYRAQDLYRVDDATLVPDAQRALSYQSPSTSAGRSQ